MMSTNENKSPNLTVDTDTAAIPPKSGEKGLPMSAKWDPEKLAKEKAALVELAKQPFPTRLVGYVKRSGPGLLQSAMTLGAGTATASVVAGASFGYKLLWVQPVAMFFGIMMFAALGNVVLTTGERPYRGFWRELGPFGWIVLFWAIGTILASVIWHIPQYGLAAGAARDLANIAGIETTVPVERMNSEGKMAVEQLFTGAGAALSFAIGLFILAINTYVVWNYGSGGRGIRIYEWFLRGTIGVVILMFGAVVIANFGKIEWKEVGLGFIGYYGIPMTGDKTIDAATITQVLGMLGAAVGINMTFLYGYTLLAKGWGNEHKTVSRWDLGLTMFLPFCLVTSLIMIGMSITLYDELPTLEAAQAQRLETIESQGLTGEAAAAVPVPQAKNVVWSSLKPIQAAKSLQAVLGEKLGQIIFCLGFICMACTAISAHMVVCGFTVCEMLGLDYTQQRFRMAAMTPAIGIFGVVATLPLWLPITASAVCFTMLPVAYIIIFVMNNKRSYIGDAVGSGIGRIVFNTLLVMALIMCIIGACIQVKTRVINELPKLWKKPAATVGFEENTKSVI